MKKYYIGVDIGGTKIASGIIGGSGKMLKSLTLPTLADKGVKVSMAQVYGAIEQIIDISGLAKKSIKGIGVCAPGPLDPIKGIVHNPPNLPGWKEVALVSGISKRFKVKCKLENDANAAGMAEMVWGAAKGYKNIFYVTVSTGIGTGIIIDGEIYHGKNGLAGEGGHVCIKYDDLQASCGCGNVGCVEGIVSGPATAKRLIRSLKKNKKTKTVLREMTDGKIDGLTMRMIGDAAKKKDKIALDAVVEQGRILGVWLGSMINVLDPEIVVIGGGVSSIGKLIFDSIKRSVSEHTINVFADKTPIVRAKLLNNVGVYGAASLMM